VQLDDAADGSRNSYITEIHIKKEKLQKQNCDLTDEQTNHLPNSVFIMSIINMIVYENIHCKNHYYCKIKTRTRMK